MENVRFERVDPAEAQLGPVKELGDLVDQMQAAVEEQVLAESVRLDDLHKRLYGFYKDEQVRQMHNRHQMAIDCDYFDSIQWTDEEIEQMAGRFPATYNIVKPTVLWLLGTEIRTRMQHKILPRGKGDEKNTEVKTKVMKYFDDVNHEKMRRSAAFKHAVVAGLGWLETQASSDPTEEILISGNESWRNILHDSCSIDPRLKDARYLFRQKVVDLDYAIWMHPQHRAHLESVAFDAGGIDTDDAAYFMGQRVDRQDHPGAKELSRYRVYDDAAPYRTTRRRVRLIEAWYRVPEYCKACVGGVAHGAPYREDDKMMAHLAQTGAMKLQEKFMMRMHAALMTEKAMLSDGYSPYRHNDFPFTPVWGYRRDRDNAPYGAIRDLRSPQDDLNKRGSKAQWKASANQLIVEKNVVQDVQALRDQADLPDGTMVLDGTNSSGRFEVIPQMDLAQGELQFIELDMRMVRDIGGVNSDNMGLRSDAQSGKAIIARQEQGSLLSQPIFENLNFALQIHGEKKLSMIEQYVTKEKAIRVTEEKKGFDWVTVNQQITNADGSTQYLNDMTEAKADFVMDEQDFRATVRESMAEMISDAMSRMPPELAMELLPSWLELLDLPDKDSVIARIQQKLGIADPDDPTSQAVEQVKQEAQQQIEAVEQEAGQQIEQLTQKLQTLEKQLIGAQKQMVGVERQRSVGEVKLANKAEELALKAEEIDNKHKEAMANASIEAATSEAPSTPQQKDAMHYAMGAIIDALGSMQKDIQSLKGQPQAQPGAGVP